MLDIRAAELHDTFEVAECIMDDAGYSLTSTVEVSMNARRVYHWAARTLCAYHTRTLCINIEINPLYFEQFKEDFNELLGTALHEIAHAWLFEQRDFEHGHGPRFMAIAEEIGFPRHCKKFAEPRYVVACTSCDNEYKRFRKSKLVKRPDLYRCGKCGGHLVATKNNNKSSCGRVAARGTITLEG